MNNKQTESANHKAVIEVKCLRKRSVICRIAGIKFHLKWCLDKIECECKFCSNIKNIVQKRIEEALFT